MATAHAESEFEKYHIVQDRLFESDFDRVIKQVESETPPKPSTGKLRKCIMATKKNTPSWTDVKTRLADFDRAGLTGLIQDLYAASKDNQAFLHARFALGDDVLKPYKATISRWLWPDWRKNQNISVAKAKKAISDYKKAIGQAHGLAELMVFYCEQAAGFSDDLGLQDAGYFDALVRMFEQALNAVAALPEPVREELYARLDSVRDIGHNFGYGVGDDMDALLSKHGLDD